jgi:hypothetical protein
MFWLIIGYWLLVIGCWLLVIGYWLLVIGYWLLVVSDRYVIEYQPTTYNKQPTTKKAAFADGFSLLKYYEFIVAIKPGQFYRKPHLLPDGQPHL